MPLSFILTNKLLHSKVALVWQTRPMRSISCTTDQLCKIKKKPKRPLNCFMSAPCFLSCFQKDCQGHVAILESFVWEQILKQKDMILH